MGKPELAESPLYKDNPSRVSNRHALDALIADWARQFDAEALIALLNAADIPNGRAYTSADCAADPQYRFRNMAREVVDPRFDKAVLQAGIVPHFPEKPGDVRWAGPEIGQHTREVLRDLAGLNEDEITHLQSEKVIA